MGTEMWKSRKGGGGSLYKEVKSSHVPISFGAVPPEV